MPILSVLKFATLRKSANLGTVREISYNCYKLSGEMQHFSVVMKSRHLYRIAGNAMVL